MHLNVWTYIVNTVFLLHVSVTHVATVREVHYKERIHRDMTEVCEP